MKAIINRGCLGVVLAGGLSSRMGQDKSQLQRDNHSMLEFSKQVLTESGIDNIIVSGDNFDVPDSIKHAGPVAGILSVIARFPQAKSLLILPVDLPFITAKALTELRLKGEISQQAVHFNDHHIPLYLPNNAYLELFLQQAFKQAGDKTSKELSTHKNSRFKHHGPSFKGLLAQVPHQTIVCSNANILFNSNTPDEWRQAKKQLNF